MLIVNQPWSANHREIGAVRVPVASDPAAAVDEDQHGRVESGVDPGGRKMLSRSGSPSNVA